MNKEQFLKELEDLLQDIDATEREEEAAKSPDPPSLQKIQPRVPQVPSRFGQEQPPFKEILYSFSPKFCFR